MSHDKKKIEETGVNHVGSVFNSVTRVLAHFNTNDKTICTDGTIEVFSSEALIKDNLIGIIDVQIKSTMGKPKQSKKPKFRMKVSDLEKYRDVYGGVILFVAFVRSDYSLRAIYYSMLLPYDIHLLLDKHQNETKKSVTLKLNALPQTPEVLYRLCREFLVDKKKQATVATIGVKSYEEWRFEGVSFETLELSKVFLPNENPLALDAFVNGVYVYGKLSSGIQVPIDKIEDPVSIALCGPSIVESGEYRERLNVEFGEDEAGQFILFPGFKLRLGNAGSIKYRDEGTFSERISAAKILLGLLETGKLIVNGITFFVTSEISEKSVEEARVSVDAYREIDELVNILGIKADWDPSLLSESDKFQIGILTKGFVSKEKVRLTCSQDQCVTLNCDIGGTRIKAIARRDENGLYELLNPLSPDIMLVMGNTEEETEINKNCPVPSLFILAEEDFRMAGNLDAAQFQQALSRYPILSGNSALACNKLLTMLFAFDKGAVCPEDLIGCARVLAEALLKADPDNERYIINQLQCAKRIRSLGPEECEAARKLMLTSEDQQVRVAASTLLGEKAATELLFSELSEDQRRSYLSWPISSLDIEETL